MACGLLKKLKVVWLHRCSFLEKQLSAGLMVSTNPTCQSLSLFFSVIHWPEIAMSPAQGSPTAGNEHQSREGGRRHWPKGTPEKGGGEAPLAQGSTEAGRKGGAARCDGLVPKQFFCDYKIQVPTPNESNTRAFITRPLQFL